jgi:hypothetical protein
MAALLFATSASASASRRSYGSTASARSVHGQLRVGVNVAPPHGGAEAAIFRLDDVGHPSLGIRFRHRARQVDHREPPQRIEAVGAPTVRT